MCEGMKYRCGDGYDRQKRWPCTWDECEPRPRVVREDVVYREKSWLDKREGLGIHVRENDGNKLMD